MPLCLGIIASVLTMIRIAIAEKACLVDQRRAEEPTFPPGRTAPVSERLSPEENLMAVDDPNDSPMVRAAKRAVASRLRNPNQRRVVSLSTSSTTTRGRFSRLDGSCRGAEAPARAVRCQAAQDAAVTTAQEAAALQKAQVQEKLKRLEAEESMLAAETDEPYGGDIEEDQVDKRLSEIEAERKKLQQEQATPPPPPQR